MSTSNDSPWLSLRDGAARLPGKRSPRFLAREIKAGRLRAARLGGRGEFCIHQDWLREYLELMAKPVIVQRRRA